MIRIPVCLLVVFSLAISHQDSLRPATVYVLAALNARLNITCSTASLHFGSLKVSDSGKYNCDVGVQGFKQFEITVLGELMFLVT